MSYRLDRSIGYRPWGVTNPWVWADYGQPQRLRGGVSPFVMKTDGHYLKNQHLGQADSLSPAEARAHRMEIMAAIGLTLTAVSFLLTAQRVIRQNLNRNRRRARRRRR